MKERPIIFGVESVRATLDGRKTQTRRLFKVNGYPITSPEERVATFDDGSFHYLSTGGMSGPYRCPYGAPGDRLWVREGWQCGVPAIPGTEYGLLLTKPNHATKIVYRASWDGADQPPWRSPLHLPHRFSRLLLEVTDVRVQRLQEISHDDAIAEGCNASYWTKADGPKPNPPGQHSLAVERFSRAWDAIKRRKPAPWSSNPWVWAVTFRCLHAGNAAVAAPTHPTGPPPPPAPAEDAA